MLKLIQLTKEYERQLKEMMEEWLSVEQRFSPYAIRKNDYHDFDKYLKELDWKVDNEQHVCTITYFLYDTDRDILLGAANLRLTLNESLKVTGGHIGDGIRPSERRKGYATKMIGMVLKECPKFGLYDILMTCDKDNIGSAKSIQKNGGIYESDVLEDGVVEERYWIHLPNKPIVKEYENGDDFLKENKDFLMENPYLNQFLILDAKFYKEKNKENYALRIGTDSPLAVIKVEPYKLMMYGNKEYIPFLIQYLKQRDLHYQDILCNEELGKEFQKHVDLLRGFSYSYELPMDFMKAREITMPTDEGIEIPTPEDIDSMYENMQAFLLECNLKDQVEKKDVEPRLKDFRIIRRDGQIVSMVSYSNSIENSVRISWVYTKPKYRGMGLGKALVNAVKNEIIESGRIPTLNVDQRNPISNHIYTSLGFCILFSHGEFRKK